ncbi:MAG: vitamin B12-dependent ribonucleotide reductase [Patescibacteria group bacterium]|nr:vitamin B12-dependent ribonucleotide reductase [Patescibacteria group bacterium]
MKKIIKRDGTAANFDREKIAEAIWKSAQSVGGKDRTIAQEISNEIENLLNILFKGDNYPTVEQVQDLVENMLIERQYGKTAKAYILYRQKRADIREQQKAIMGKTTNLPLSLNALQVLERRYLLKDENNRIMESPEDLFRRVAKNIAEADKNYKKGNAQETEEKFYKLMTQLEFMPNSPTLMNAGTDIQQLSACFVLPVEDSMENIFDTVKNAALIHKSGGGTGFSFSRLRPRNDLVKSTTGVSSGPISFMRVFDVATDVIKQGGKRRGANMGILRVDHPDILDFITMKSDMVTLTNFNISVGITDKFMEALDKNKDYELLNPRDGQVVQKLPARHVFDLILDMAWKNGDPGVIFLDTINKADKIPHTGLIESTNPCGEQPLKGYESCNLGSINLNRMIRADHSDLDWDKFRETIHSSIHFLDNVIDMNKYPIPKIAEVSRASRKVGLGLMGFGDILYQLKVPYNSKEGLEWADKITSFLKTECENKSIDLAKDRGVFPCWKGSYYEKKGIKIRNACQTTIAPTGTIGMIAEASGGIEPNFAISYIKNVMDGTELVYTNKYFEQIAKEKGFYSQDLMREIAESGSVQNIEAIPASVRKVFVTAQDIAPEWHVKAQAAFQKHIDSAVSKTVNFPHLATTKDIEKSYKSAYKLGCKGITVYRDGSRDNQVLNIGKVKGKKKIEEDQRRHKSLKQSSEKSKAEIKKEGVCPDCEGKLIMHEGCMSCPQCSYSACSVA